MLKYLEVFKLRRMHIMSSNKIVYVLINPAMPGYVKIGRTTDIKQRLLGLDNTSMPLPFECFYASLVRDDIFVEKQLHKTFEDNRTRKNREFFEISPERVVAALKLAEIEDVTPREDIVENSDDQTALNKARTRRANFNFSKLGIPIGAKLIFTRNEDIQCEVHSPNKVIFNDTVQSLSAAAKEALEGEGVLWKAVQGPLFWQYQGKTIDELREL